MKTIDTLVRDIYKTLQGRGDWNGFRGNGLGVSIGTELTKDSANPKSLEDTYLFPLLVLPASVSFGTK